MKKNSYLVSVLTVGAGAGLAACFLAGCGRDAEAQWERQERAEEAARAKDPAWRPSHEEVSVIRIAEKDKAGEAQNFCLNRDGNLLVCWSEADKDPSGDAGKRNMASQILTFSPEGKRLKEWPVDMRPEAICVGRDGTIFVGGEGRLLALDQQGKVLASTNTPAMAQKVKLSAATIAAMQKNRKLSDEQLADYEKRRDMSKSAVPGIAVTDKELFVVNPSSSDFGYTVYRMGYDFKDPKAVIDGLSGCCGQMDLQAAGDKLWIPHNGKHRVECRDRDGKQILAFGKYDRKAADGFGGCCEPKNIRIASNGDVFAAESGPPVAIKRFSAEGKFLGMAALPKFKNGCVRATVDVSPDAGRIYVLNTGDNTIHVLAPGEKAVAAN